MKKVLIFLTMVPVALIAIGMAIASVILGDGNLASINRGFNEIYDDWADALSPEPRYAYHQNMSYRKILTFGWV